MGHSLPAAILGQGDSRYKGPSDGKERGIFRNGFKASVAGFIKQGGEQLRRSMELRAGARCFYNLVVHVKGFVFYLNGKSLSNLNTFNLAINIYRKMHM